METTKRPTLAEPWLCTIWLLLLCAKAAVVIGAPIRGQDLNSCQPIIPAGKTEAVDCCILNRTIKAFTFNPHQPTRVRRPAHKLDEEFIDKYNKAYELLRALPEDDPRSWTAQFKLHCAACPGVYLQADSSELFDAHHNWLLMPFHRWYIYFHERILGSLIGDDTFALPYWAWDVQNETNPPANVIPAIYTNNSSPLYDEIRSQIHQPPKRADLDYSNNPAEKDPSELLRYNYYHMWRAMISETKTPEAFYGGKFSNGDPALHQPGVFESVLHAGIHFWVGDETLSGADMRICYSAAKDPVFFAHHSQLDRLWVMWKEMGGRDYDDPDWLDAEFLFYDENADLVRVNVRDSLDWSEFNIEYEQVAADWLDHVPVSIRTNNPGLAKKGVFGQLREILGQIFAGEKTLAMMLGIFPRESQKTILKGRAALTWEVARPRASTKRLNLKSGAASVEEVLLIEGSVTAPLDMAVVFNVFLDLPEADQSSRLDCAESIGSILVNPVAQRRGKDVILRRFSQQYSIGDRFDQLDIRGSSSVDITFVPRWEEGHDNDIYVEFTKVAMLWQ